VEAIQLSEQQTAELVESGIAVEVIGEIVGLAEVEASQWKHVRFPTNLEIVAALDTVKTAANNLADALGHLDWVTTSMIEQGQYLLARNSNPEPVSQDATRIEHLTEHLGKLAMVCTAAAAKRQGATPRRAQLPWILACTMAKVFIRRGITITQTESGPAHRMLAALLDATGQSRGEIRNYLRRLIAQGVGTSGT
jgi:hypothetical protein